MLQSNFSDKESSECPFLLVTICPWWVISVVAFEWPAPLIWSDIWLFFPMVKDLTQISHITSKLSTSVLMIFRKVWDAMETDCLGILALYRLQYNVNRSTTHITSEKHNVNRSTTQYISEKYNFNRSTTQYIFLRSITLTDQLHNTFLRNSIHSVDFGTAPLFGTKLVFRH